MLMNKEQKLLTPTEVAQMLGVNSETLNVWRATKRYNLPYVKVGRLVRYTQSAIEEFIAARTQAANSP